MKNEKRKMKKEKNLSIFGSSFPLYLSSFIFHLSFLIVLCGCQGGGWLNTGGDVIANLADTVYAGENREVLLTDLTGGYYFDDAFRQPDYGEYGYSRWGWRYVAGWRATRLDGQPLDDEPVAAVSLPDVVERRYRSGLIECVELPPERPGMLLTLKTNRGGLALRPLFDIRDISREDAPEYVLHDAAANGVAVARRDLKGGWLATLWSGGVRFSQESGNERIDYRSGAQRGRTGVATCRTIGEMVLSKSGKMQVAFAWGKSPEEAFAAARTILVDQKDWRGERRKWMLRFLSAVSFQSEDQRFPRAFTRARLTLAALIVTRPIGGPDSLARYSNSQTFLFTGIPYQPYPDGWFTMFSLPGIAAMEGTPDLTLKLIPPILARQNRDTSSAKYGMLPGRIDQNGPEYRAPMISGLAAMAYNDFNYRLIAKDTVLEESLARACLNDLLGTARHRLVNGITAGDTADHIFWDGPAAPRRAGATIETQVLFGKTRQFLMRYPRLDVIAPDVPPSLLKDDPAGWTVTSFHIKGPKKLVDAADEAWRTKRYVAGATEIFTQPLPTDVALMYFNFLGREPEADRLPLVIQDSLPLLQPTEPDTTVRAALFLAHHWEFTGDKKGLAKMMGHAETYGMTTPFGLRSLSPEAPDYQPQHLYYLEESTAGSVFLGDALLWTSGILGDAYIVAEEWKNLRQMVFNLADFSLASGAVGALPEATDAETITDEMTINGSPVFSASLAEYIRLVTGGLLGIVPERGRLLRLRPRLPDDWGNFRVETAYLSGRVWLERKSATVWRVGEEGIAPDLRVVLDIIPAPDERAQTSLRLVPGDELKVTFTPITEGVWKAEVEGY